MGGFSTVYLVQNVSPSEEKFAMKKVELFDDFNEDLAMNELKILRILSLNPHPCVVSLKDSFKTENGKYLCFVMEHIRFDLASLMKSYFDQDFAIEFDEAKMYSHQLFHALAHVHSLEIIHRLRLTF